MDVTILQATVIVGALIFACSALLRSHLAAGTLGSAILAAPRGYAADAIPFPMPASPTPAPRKSQQQQTNPADWFAQDAKVQRVVMFTGPAGPAQKGQWNCACGGAWRYSLGGGPAELWRCLHCGGLHSGLDLVPED